MSFSKGAQTPEARAREAQAQFMEETVQKVEKYFGKLCLEMSGVTRKSARLRDVFDQLAKTCLEYANAESGPLNKSLTGFAERISAIQDYRQAEIERLEAKVVNPLATYGAECKHTQDDLSKSFKARNREVKQQQKVVNIQNKSPSNRHAIFLAEAELQKRTLDVARSSRNLEETIDKFEVKKVQDLKNILSEFMKIEMLFHAKALEIYSIAYNDLVSFDEDEHIEAFRNTLRPDSKLQERLELARNTANLSLNSTRSSTVSAKSSNQPTPKPRERTNTRSSAEQESEEDEEEDGWDSDEESEEDYEDTSAQSTRRAVR